MKASSLFPGMNCNNSCHISVRMSTEAENPEIKEISDEVIFDTHNIEEEFIDTSGNLLQIEMFTQEGMDMHIADCEGQLM